MCTNVNSLWPYFNFMYGFSVSSVGFWYAICIRLMRFFIQIDYIVQTFSSDGTGKFKWNFDICINLISIFRISSIRSNLFLCRLSMDNGQESSHYDFIKFLLFLTVHNECISLVDIFFFREQKAVRRSHILQPITKKSLNKSIQKLYLIDFRY